MNAIIKKTSKGWILTALLFLVVFTWVGGDANLAMAQDIQYACENITPEQMEQFNIVVAKWVPAGTTDITYLSGTATVPFSHCYILTEVRGGGIYNPNGSLAGVNETGRFPAIATIRVPHSYDGSTVINIFVGGQSDHTGNQLELLGFHQFSLLGPDGIKGLEHRAFAFSKNFPTAHSPFCDEHPEDCPAQFPPDASYNAQDWPLNTLVLGHHTRDLMNAIFGGVKYQIGIGFSLGGFGAISLVGDQSGGPFNGTGTRAGAGGIWSFEEDRNFCFAGDPPTTIPLNGRPLPPDFCSIEGFVGTINLVDPEYAQEILDLLPSDPAGARQLVLDYNVLDRPKVVQNNVEKLTAGGNLKVSLIIVQGTVDQAALPHWATLAWREIMKWEKTDMARLYFLKDLNHTLGPNAPAAAKNHVEFLKAAVKWAEEGMPPGPLTMTIRTPPPFPMDKIFQAENCTGLGLEEQPCECWDVVTGTTACKDNCSQLGICDD